MPSPSEQLERSGPPPGVGVRFSSTYQPEGATGRTPTRFLRSALSKTAKSVPSISDWRKAAKLSSDDGESVRDAMVQRTLQIAFTDRVIVVGYDRKSETPIERVSSIECLKAIEILLKYDIGLPKKGAGVSVPPGTDKSRSTYDIALETYRERLLSGEMSDDELLAVTKIFAEAEKAEAEMIARILGDKSEQSKALRDRVERLLERMEARMNAADTPKVIEAQVVSGEGKAPSE